MASKPRKEADHFINEIVAIDGRLLHLFEANDDEIFVEGKGAAHQTIKAGIAEPSLFDWVQQ